MKQLSRSHFPLLTRRSLMRGAIGVTAATAFPTWSHAAEALGSTGDKVILSDSDLMDLQKSIAGAVILPSSPEYNDERRVWNPEVDHHPALIAKCTSLEDIHAALQFARSHNLLTAIRCGGHNYGGTGMADGGITLDISPFNGVEVDQSKMRAWVKGGSLLRDLDRATIPTGLVTTAGVVSHTGVGGLATAIGQGRLARSYGYTIDNIRGVDLITPDGRSVHADATENTDLFWAIRGGGGNFGIVTKFELEVYEFDSNVTSISYTYPAAKAADVLKVLFELGDLVPNAMSLSGGIRTNGQGETTSSLSGNYAGSPEAAKEILAPYIAKLGEPLRTRVNGMDYLALQGIADGTLLSERSVYYRSGFFNHVDDRIADAVADYGTTHTHPGSQISFGHQAGVTSKVASDAMAYPHRDTIYQCYVNVNWGDPEDGPATRKYADDSWDVIGPMAASGFHVNLITDPTDADVRRVYGANYARLVKIKDKYDPTNFLHLNTNIKPSRAT